MKYFFIDSISLEMSVKYKLDFYRVQSQKAATAYVWKQAVIPPFDFAYVIM